MAPFPLSTLAAVYAALAAGLALVSLLALGFAAVRQAAAVLGEQPAGASGSIPCGGIARLGAGVVVSIGRGGRRLAGRFAAAGLVGLAGAAALAGVAHGLTLNAGWARAVAAGLALVGLERGAAVAARSRLAGRLVGGAAVAGCLLVLLSLWFDYTA